MASIEAAAVPETGGLESAADTPKSERRFPCLDGYRAIAAYLVLLTHVGFETGRSVKGFAFPVLARGDIGVPIFFVLSGFLLYRPMARARLSGRPQPNVRTYLGKRLLRIVPAYWVSVVVTLSLLAQNVAYRGDLHQWLSFLGFSEIYSVSSAYGPVGLEQDWSLCVELTFYVTLPLWPILLRRLARGRPSIAVEFAGAAGLLVAALAFMIIVHLRNSPITFLAGNWLPEYLEWFAGGMLLAVVSLIPEVGPDLQRLPSWLNDLAESPSSVLLLALGIYAIVMTRLGGPYDLGKLYPGDIVCKELLYGAFAVIFLIPGVLGPQDKGLWRRFLQSRPMSKLGEASYGLFLWHLPALYFVLHLEHRYYPAGNFWRTLLFTSLLGWSLAFASLYLIERPALRLKNRLTARTPATY